MKQTKPKLEENDIYIFIYILVICPCDARLNQESCVN